MINTPTTDPKNILKFLQEIYRMCNEEEEIIFSKICSNFNLTGVFGTVLKQESAMLEKLSPKYYKWALQVPPNIYMAEGLMTRVTLYVTNSKRTNREEKSLQEKQNSFNELLISTLAADGFELSQELENSLISNLNELHKEFVNFK